VNKLGRAALVVLVCGALSWSVSSFTSGARRSPPGSHVVVAEIAPIVVSPELAELDARIAAHRARAEQREDNWLEWEFTALGLMDRARLTGDYRDFQQADEAIARAFAHASTGAGPHLTRAMLNFTVHRIDRVESDLARTERYLMLSSADRAAVRSLRADVAFYSGEYELARRLYQEQLAFGRDAAALVALAQLDWKTGRLEEADALLDEAWASAGSSVSMQAWLCLVRATRSNDQRRFEDALVQVRRGLALSPDDAHLSQMAADLLSRSGRSDAALEIDRDLAARTSSPQAMDGAAEILRDDGDLLAFAELRDAARSAYEAQIALFPEAAYGHAVDHWLRLEDDTDMLIEIAEGNAAARPFGDSQVRLAMAYLRAHRDEDARDVVDRLLLTEWNTGEMHAVAALAYERTGDERRAESERSLAELSAPGIVDATSWLSEAR